MQRIIINRSIGGFSLSTQAILWLRKRDCQAAIDTVLAAEKKYPIRHKGKVWDANAYYPLIERDDPLLIECFEELGSAFYSDALDVYKIVEVPDDVAWELCEQDDGYEWIAEVHRTWS